MSHEITEVVLLCASALLAGIVNSVAGGGTLLTFPALVWTLGTSVGANATSTTVLFPGSLAAAWGYRRELKDQRRWIIPLIVPSLIGGFLGSWLVVSQPEKIFEGLVPWLILLATFLFLLQPVITRWTGIGAAHQQPSPVLFGGIMVFQFLVALYGGYFGAGIGILMLSSLALMGVGDIHRMNALKSLLASAINGTSVLLFIGYGKVNWQFAAPMIAAAIVGGFLGASVARRLNKNLVRYSVIAIGFVLSGYYFARPFLLSQGS
jgi:uncharacterized membrane protein YfcA